MANWIETYRGAVPPWQCDVTEHFTVAYYFDRVEEARANLADALGFADLAKRGDIVRQVNARFARELRAGASFHLESAALPSDNGLRIGHRVVDSADGEVCTWFDESWNVPAPAGLPLGDWNGPDRETRDDPTDLRTVPTARGRVKTADVDANGHFSLGGIIHRFSNSSGQFGCAIGFDGNYMHKNRRGFSTFELILVQTAALPLDAPYLIETGAASFGNSSLRMLHRMTDPRSGQEIARLSQYGVNLDLDARRPAKWPEEIRARAAKL